MDARGRAVYDALSAAEASGFMRRDKSGGVSFSTETGSGPTAALCCYVDPSSVESALVRELKVFTIEARTAREAEQVEGGDSFFVAIRGRGESVRAKVLDQKNGKYAVGFKPIVSGRTRHTRHFPPMHAQRPCDTRGAQAAAFARGADR